MYVTKDDIATLDIKITSLINKSAVWPPNYHTTARTFLTIFYTSYEMNKLILSEPAIIKISRSEDFPLMTRHLACRAKKLQHSPKYLPSIPPPKFFVTLPPKFSHTSKLFATQSTKIFPTPQPQNFSHPIPKMFPSLCCTLPHSTLRPSCGSKFSNFSFATRTTLSFAHCVVKLSKI